MWDLLNILASVIWRMTMRDLSTIIHVLVRHAQMMLTFGLDTISFGSLSVCKWSDNPCRRQIHNNDRQKP